MAKNGMNIKILQYIMGHAHSDVTMDVYNHIAGIEDVKEEILNMKELSIISVPELEKMV